MSASIVSLLACGSDHVWIGGDVHWGEGVPDIAGVAPEGVGFVNIEGPVVAGGVTPPRLANDPAGLPRLFEAGVRVAGVLNNHTQDTGWVGGTVASLERAGMRGAGAAVVDGVVFTQEDLSAGYTAEIDARLARERPEGRPWIAAFHVVGDGYLPSAATRDAVERAVAYGADVVAVHGTHLVGPVERRDHAVIAWGLGNLAFSCDCTRETEAILLDVSLPDLHARVVPIRAGLDGAPARPHEDPAAVYTLLAALGSSPIASDGSF